MQELFKPVDTSLKDPIWFLELEPSLAAAICKSLGFVEVWDDFWKTWAEDEKVDPSERICLFRRHLAKNPVSERWWTVAVLCLACVLKLMSCKCNVIGKVFCYLWGVGWGPGRNTGYFNTKFRALPVKGNWGHLTDALYFFISVTMVCF